VEIQKVMTPKEHEKQLSNDSLVLTHHRHYENKGCFAAMSNNCNTYKCQTSTATAISQYLPLVYDHLLSHRSTLKMKTYTDWSIQHLNPRKFWQISFLLKHLYRTGGQSLQHFRTLG